MMIVGAEPRVKRKVNGADKIMGKKKVAAPPPILTLCTRPVPSIDVHAGKTRGPGGIQQSPPLE